MYTYLSQLQEFHAKTMYPYLLENNFSKYLCVCSINNTKNKDCDIFSYFFDVCYAVKMANGQTLPHHVKSKLSIACYSEWSDKESGS